jgi:tetratricopeptide (TPR) repeat protein
MQTQAEEDLRRRLARQFPVLHPFGAAFPRLVFLLAVVFSCFILSAQNTPSPNKGLRIIVASSAEQAQQILDRLKNGEDFAALAEEKSVDATAEDGGYMGRVDPAALRPELREALKEIAPGQITGVIKVPTGFAILKVLSADDSAGDKIANLARIQPLTATGTVRYTPSVGGKNEADLAFRSLPKPEGWSQDLTGLCSIRKKSVSIMIDQLETNLRPSNAGGQDRTSPLDQIETIYGLANLYSYQGAMDKAVAQWESAYQIAINQLPGAMPELEEVLGIAYLHKSEMENGVYQHPDDRCIFPPRSSIRNSKTADSLKAVEYLTKYLERKPDALDVRWLLNLGYLMLGGYPDQVPSKYLIPPSAFASRETVGRFVDVAEASGIKTFGESAGIIVDDFDNDGLLDVVLSDYDQCGAMHFFHNNGDGTFSDRTAAAGLSGQLGGYNMIQTDYNNDGCLDILVLRGAWEFAQRKSLLKNNCDGTFTDVTAASGLAQPATSTQAAVWADIDNDGFLDLIIGNENGAMQLFRNKGDGTFEDIAAAAGINRAGFTKSVVAADYDNDGYPDLFVSNANGNKYLFHNNRDRTFTDLASEAGVQKPYQSYTAWFFDYDNDGWPDLFVTSYYVSVDETMRTYLGLPPNAETMKLFKNMKDGSFRDVTQEVQLDKVFMSMGANFGDIDNDGYPDIYLGTGNPSYASLVPNVLLRNHDGKFFADVTASSGTGELHKTHGISFADVSNSGNEDLLVQVGGATPGDSHAFRLFKNPGKGNDWINLHLVGVKSNRAAIGARIKITVENGKSQRTIYRTVGSGGSFGASPLAQHIGLGKAARIVDLEIWWPTSNTRQNFSQADKNQFLEIKEFAKDYTRLERHPLRSSGVNQTSALAPKWGSNDPAGNVK